ncbi:MAG: histidinol dehydrogenase [Acidiferrobacterales bacterium]|nr:histidinol dehydrogenase [Acidiferrobacterales bacterium]
MSTINIRQLDSIDKDFQAAVDALLDREQESDVEAEKIAREVVDTVRRGGDKALLEYTARFDRFTADNVAALEISLKQLQAAREALADDARAALEQAAERVRRYHEHQKSESWRYTETDGTVLGQQVTPLDRVGLYVPGGKAAYPSSVLMNAIPAKVAGVAELIMVVPTPDGVVNEMVLAAAAIAGVDRVFAIGGAQAVAALAYGTETIPKVDKIVGPGNIYVANAKRLVFGAVDIDMIAGPSEIVVVCDGETDADWVAMDLFSQAEHDELAQSILISTDAEFTSKVKAAMERLLDDMPRRDIIKASLEGRGALITVANDDAAIELVNTIAPEHLELSVADPEAMAARVRHAGAIFMGRYTAEAVGDYCAGPNHVLPTSGTARFSSPLGVYDFQKRSSLIMCTADSADQLGRTASVLARGEGLVAHARSAEYRVKD